MSLFLDSNVWLSFYHYSNDDLEELRKLLVLIEKKKLELLLPEQVVDEVRRNRDNKIANALDSFKGEKLNGSFLRICHDYEEYDVMRKAVRDFQSAKAKLIEKLRSDSLEGSLKADEIIKQLFSAARRIPVSEAILTQAKQRHDRGNPPGKVGSYGDAVNWECLLGDVPEKQDLFFISGDGDFASKIDGEVFSPFLAQEWSEMKGAAIHFSVRISTFFEGNFPEIKFATDLEKELLVTELVESSSFAVTRRALAQLVRYDGSLKASQINSIVDAALTNNQIYWIVSDSDIKLNLRSIIEGGKAGIEDVKLDRFRRLLAGKAWGEDDATN
ncbi:MAG TPA: PIN domain-containing protein [Thermoanaerobaculia bacterium]|jgi:predicted nucleic acid-binding protein|nr:PIN domain-containing protein [Thermoanaerobaculia bacterium]